MRQAIKIIATTATILTGFLLAAETQAIAPAACNAVSANTAGFFGSYYNLQPGDPGMFTQGRSRSNSVIGGNNPWYDQRYLSLERVDQSLNFGNNFFPLNESLPNDPFDFAVHWRARLVAPTANTYSFSTNADDDSWVLIDNSLVVNNGGMHAARLKSGSIYLTTGSHLIDIYYAERSRTGSVFDFKSDASLIFYALPPSCGNLLLNGAPTSGGQLGRVAGTSTAAYTKATALYRTKGTPDVYAIYENGRRHYISGPTAFAKYGYKYSDVKDVSLEVLNRYPDTELVRTPEDAVVYHLSARAKHQWLKIPLLTPTVFASYERNYWGDLAVIDELDLMTYQNVELIKVANQPTLYLLKNATRRPFLSEEVLINLGYNPNEAITITDTHLKSFQEGEPIG